MPAPVLVEYRNQNSQRQYPFSDDALLTDNTGQRLPVDFLVDAFLYPIDIVGRPYLSKIDLGEGTIHFADSETSRELGVAEFNVHDTEAYVYESDYGRQIGILAFGEGLPHIFQGATIRIFLAEQTPFAPTAYIPLNQSGVRGFILPSGDVVSGDVIFEGRNGVQVTSENTMEGIPLLRIDVIGVPDIPLEDCREVCIPIREICIERKSGSAVDISQYGDDAVALFGSGFDLTDICESQRVRRLPDSEGNLPYGKDICTEPPPDPPEPYPDEDSEVCFEAAEIGPYLFIINPSSVDHVNPISIQPIHQLGLADAPRLLQAGPVTDISDFENQIRAFTSPPFMADGIVIGIRGLPVTKRVRR